MIYDDINHRNLYFKHPIFDEIFAELAKITTSTPNGMIKNHDGYYFNVMEYETESSPTIIELHRKEVDIQVLLKGEEIIQIFDERGVRIDKAYDENSDCQFYVQTGKPIVQMNLSAGKMAVFFPQDIHYAKHIVAGIPTKLKKVVVKVKREYFS